MAVSLGGVCIVDNSIKIEDITDSNVRNWVEKYKPEPGHLAVVEALPDYVTQWFDNRTDGLSVGGGAANVAWRLTDLDVETEIWGRVGSDKQGVFYCETLKQRGADVSRVKVCDGGQTSRTLVIEEKDDRCFIHVLGENLNLTSDDYQSSDETWGDYVGYLYIFGKWPDSGRDMGEIVARMNERKKVSMLATTADPRGTWDGAEPALRNADIFFLNKMEAQGMIGVSDEHTAATALHRMGVRLVSMTLGKHGAFLSKEKKPYNRFYRSTCYDELKPRVRRAAGDSFAAGVIAAIDILGLYKNDDFDLVALSKYGNAMGSLAVAGYDHINPVMVKKLFGSKKI